MKKNIILAISDFKLIFRDPSLRTFLVFPFILLGVFVWFLPNLVDKYDFLKPYISIFLMIGVIENTQLFSFISSMVLIDEKETDVAKVYGVVPLSKVQYIVSRLFIPFLITVFFNIILLKAQTLYRVEWIPNLTISILTALVVPVFVLGMNTLAKNRIQGMIYFKTLNIIVLLPLAVYFLPEKFKYVFSVIPTHWIFQSIQNTSQDLSITKTAIVGFVFSILLLILVSKKFIKKHFV
jgi:fluoroquinolone transport system permease protein